VTPALSVNVDGAVEWLAALYGHAQTGWINLWSPAARASPVWAPVDRIDLLRHHIERLGERGDLYFGVALRRDRLAEGRGGKADCGAIPGVWIDLDWLSEVHRNPRLPATRELAIELARSFPLKPSAVVNTGWGFQVWWLFAEPLDAAEAVVLLARWEATWEKLAANLGVDIDHVWNIDRVMRLPGGFNHKRDPLAVSVNADYQKVYQPSDFDEHLEPAPPPPERRPHAYTGHLGGSMFNRFVTGGEVLAAQGWQLLARQPSNGDRHWHHPGSSNENSATVYADDGYTCVWSDTVVSLTGCPKNKPMDPFGLYTWLAHRGDFSAAHTALDRMGFKDTLTLPPLPPLTVPSVPALVVPTLRPRLRSLAEIGRRRVEWLWKPWIPFGKISSIFGLAGVGKSTLVLDIGARLSWGLPMPDGGGDGEPGAVILLSAEDDPEDTLSYRFAYAGGNMDRAVYFDDLETPEGEVVPFTLPVHVDVLGDAIATVRATKGVRHVLVVWDVLNSYIDERVETNADSKVRRMLRPLQNLLRATRAACTVIRHPRKGGGLAVEAGSGSMGFTGSFRCEMVAGYHPEDPSQRVLAMVKNNLARIPPSLMYQLELVREDTDYHHVVWGKECNVVADQLTDPTLAVREHDGPAMAEARRLIREVLKDTTMESQDLLNCLMSYGLSKDTIKKARIREGIESKPVRDKDGRIVGWRVSYPDHPERA
jgi:hypothetical protein